MDYLFCEQNSNTHIFEKVFTIQAVCTVFTRHNRNIGHLLNTIVLIASDTHSEAEDFIFIKIFVIKSLS